MEPLALALLVFQYVVMVLSISVHDAAQAYTAQRLGDPTAFQLGRVSINPLRHFDAFGMGLWPAVSLFFNHIAIGWGKPVPMQYRNFRRKDGEVLSICAGPVAQLALALLCLVALIVVKHTVPGADDLLVMVQLMGFGAPVSGMAGLPPYLPMLVLLYFGITVNLLLFAFNLVPMPFLDGGKVLVYFLPYNAARWFEANQMWFIIGFFFIGFRLIFLIFGPMMAIFSHLLLRL